MKKSVCGRICLIEGFINSKNGHDTPNGIDKSERIHLIVGTIDDKQNAPHQIERLVSFGSGRQELIARHGISTQNAERANPAHDRN